MTQVYKVEDLAEGIKELKELGYKPIEMKPTTLGQDTYITVVFGEIK